MAHSRDRSALKKQSRRVRFVATKKGIYEFFSTGTRARATERLRVSRIQRTDTHSATANPCHPQRPRRDRLRRNRHRKNRRILPSHNSKDQRKDRKSTRLNSS